MFISFVVSERPLFPGNHPIPLALVIILSPIPYSFLSPEGKIYVCVIFGVEVLEKPFESDEVIIMEQ